jgi:hypothetical protein
VSFVSVNVTTDPDLLLDTAVDAISATLATNGYPGWSAADATLVVIVLNAVCQLIADGTLVASTAWPAIWRAFGTQLLNVPYTNGATASVLSTWTFTGPSPASGYDIPAGTGVTIGNLGFVSQSDYTSNPGDTTAIITLIATQPGTAYNGVGGVDTGYPTVQQQTGIDYVASVVTQGLTSNGQDQQTDTDYQNQLVATLQIYAVSVVNANDYPPAAQSDVAENATGVSVGRATSLDLYYPDGRALSTGGTTSPTVLSCSLTTSSNTVYYTGSGSQAPAIGATVVGTGVPSATTVVSATDSSFVMSAAATVTGAESLTISAMSGYGPVHLTCTANLTSSSATVAITTPSYYGAIPDIGARVTGAGVPNGTTVLGSPAPSSSSFTMSANASANETGETMTISSWTNVERCVTTFITDSEGNAQSAANMDALQAWYGTLREVGFLPFVTAPSYNTVYVSTTVHCLPSYDPASVAANVQTALISVLSPAAWGASGGPSTGSTVWLNSGAGFNLIRLNVLLGIVQNVPGVQYVPDGGLTLGFSASPTGTADLVMLGPAPLPATSVSTVLVSIV